MPWGDWINEFPTEFFMVVHIAAFALGAGLRMQWLKREVRLLGTSLSGLALG